MHKIKAVYLSGFLAKIRGLIGFQKPYAVFFHTRFGLHTFGLKFPIDVVILNREYRVVRSVSNLSPNRIYFWPLSYDAVLELPEGEINRLQIKDGSLIKLNL